MKKPALAIVTALALSLGGFASLQAQSAPEKPGAMDASRVEAGVYTADPGHTLVEWSVDHFGFSDYFGLFGDVDGTLRLDPANLSDAQVDVTIPVASVTVASEGLRDHLLRPGKDGANPDFFGPSPDSARFTSTAVRPFGDNQALIEGNLTLNGVTKPVSVVARFMGAGTNPMNKKATVGFEGTATIKRSDFGINYGIPLVSDMVELTIAAAFERSGDIVARPAVNACFVGKSNDYIGQYLSPELRTGLEEAAVGPLRVYRRGDPLTTDYRPTRLNVALDSTGHIESIGCG